MTKEQTITIELTERELKDVKLIRKYFVMNDETCHQQFLYSVADMLVKKSQLKPQEGESNLLLRELAMRGNYAFPINKQDEKWFEEGMGIKKSGDFEERLFTALD